MQRDPRTIAAAIARSHHESLDALRDDLADAIDREIRRAGGDRPRAEPADFFAALHAVTATANPPDREAYMRAWEALVTLCGYDPHWSPPREPATCGPMLQWGEVACRLHGTAIAREGVPVCVVTGDALTEKPR